MGIAAKEDDIQPFPAAESDNEGGQRCEAGVLVELMSVIYEGGIECGAAACLLTRNRVLVTMSLPARRRCSRTILSGFPRLRKWRRVRMICVMQRENSLYGM